MDVLMRKCRVAWPASPSDVAQHVEQLAAAAAPRAVRRRRRREERQAQAALQAEAQRPRGQAERLVLGDGVEEEVPACACDTETKRTAKDLLRNDSDSEKPATATRGVRGRREASVTRGEPVAARSGVGAARSRKLLSIVENCYLFRYRESLNSN